MPPSVNHMWTIGRRGGVGMRLSDDYRVWKKLCAQLCMEKRWHKAPIKGPYSLTIVIDRDRCRKGSDLGNREKAVSDFLQMSGIVENDNLAESITLKWGEAHLGCRVTVEAA